VLIAHLPAPLAAVECCRLYMNCFGHWVHRAE
jgi:hypothetical protein